jgi:hypothetical protein
MGAMEVTADIGATGVTEGMVDIGVTEATGVTEVMEATEVDDGVAGAKYKSPISFLHNIDQQLNKRLH